MYVYYIVSISIHKLSVASWWSVALPPVLPRPGVETQFPLWLCCLAGGGGGGGGGCLIYD